MTATLPNSLILLAAMIVPLTACNKPAVQPAPLRPVIVMTVQSHAGGQLAAYSGEVRARHEADLGFRIGGKVLERKVSVGDSVRKGTVLARLDARDVQLSNASVQAQVQAAEADLALAQNEYDRARALNEKRFLSESAVETRRTQLDAATARLKQAKAQFGVSGNQLTYATLSADSDGVITAAPVEVGQVVSAGQAVVRLADPREREVLIWIPESRLTAIKRGQAVTVRPWNAQTINLPGTVREVAASADVATRTYAVKITIPIPGNDLTLGSTALVLFPTASADNRVYLPLPALTGRDTQNQVWVVGADNKVQARKVEVEAYRDDVAVIKSGLASGERVVVVGAHKLIAGLPVSPVEQGGLITLDIHR